MQAEQALRDRQREELRLWLEALRKSSKAEELVRVPTLFVVCSALRSARRVLARAWVCRFAFSSSTAFQPCQRPAQGSMIMARCVRVNPVPTKSQAARLRNQKV